MRDKWLYGVCALHSPKLVWRSKSITLSGCHQRKFPLHLNPLALSFSFGLLSSTTAPLAVISEFSWQFLSGVLWSYNSHCRAEMKSNFCAELHLNAPHQLQHQSTSQIQTSRSYKRFLSPALSSHSPTHTLTHLYKEYQWAYCFHFKGKRRA